MCGQRDESYKRRAQFWGKIFLITFAMGVATGIVQAAKQPRIIAAQPAGVCPKVAPFEGEQNADGHDFTGA